MSDIESEWRDLMVRGLAGDGVAYRRLLEALAPRLRAFVDRRLMHDGSGVEDVVQETLLAIHRFRDRYDPRQPVAPWVYAIARRKLIDHIRRKRRSGPSVPIDAVQDFLKNAQADDLTASQDIATLLAKLPPNQSEAIRLVKLEDMSVRDASTKTGMSEASIKINVHRGLKKLAALVAKADQR